MTSRVDARANAQSQLHLHLEGTVRSETLWDLADRAGVPLPAKTREALRAKYAFDSFAGRGLPL
jgi:adenosine deaminase